MNKEILGNSLEHLKTMKSESIDLILTDPPYNTTDCKWDKKIEWVEWWTEWKRIIKPTGSIIITCQMPFLVEVALGGLDLYRHKWVWRKDKCGNFMVAKSQPLKTTEDVLIFSKTGYHKSWNNNGKPKSIYNPQMTTSYNKTNNGTSQGESLKAINNRPKKVVFKSDSKKDPKSRYPKDIIYFPVPYGKDRHHPTQKPVGLFEYFIKTYTNEGMTVLDCFAGYFTTAIACLNTDRKYICIEQEKDIYIKAVDRVEKWHKEKKSRLF